MNVNRQQLHDLVDVVDTAELEVIYHVLVKFVPEDVPTPDEIEAIEAGRDSLRRGEGVRHEDIDWS